MTSAQAQQRQAPARRRKRGPWLGCIADDHTGATDLASSLLRAGARPVLRFGPPPPGWSPPPGDAVVVGLKVRTAPVEHALEQVTSTQRALATLGVQQWYSKYCSTFDSTAEGNIGPISDALLDALGADIAVACPTSPEHGRTVHQGHLFVGEQLLSHSPMRQHPLTPMGDSDIVSLLSRQTSRPVGLVTHAAVRRGARAVRSALHELSEAGVRHAVVDAATEDDLNVVASAGDDGMLMTGGAGLARAVVREMLAGQGTEHEEHVREVPRGWTVILSGSCSATTLRQVEKAARDVPTHRLDPGGVTSEQELFGKARTFLDEHAGRQTVLVASSADADRREAGSATFGSRTAAVLEEAMGRLARHAVDAGARRLVVAGGETAGAVTSALGVDTVLVADEADVGVPWCVTTDEPRLALLLKSGNFGRDDLFLRAANS